jgi:hypothetical protein
MTAEPGAESLGTKVSPEAGIFSGKPFSSRTAFSRDIFTDNVKRTSQKDRGLVDLTAGRSTLN